MCQVREAESKVWPSFKKSYLSQKDIKGAQKSIASTDGFA